MNIVVSVCVRVCEQDMCDGRDGSFRVLVENEGCGIAEHRCGKSISVYYQGGLITMQHRQVTTQSLNSNVYLSS